MADTAAEKRNVALCVRVSPAEKRALEIAVFQGEAKSITDAVRQAINARWAEQVAMSADPDWRKH